MAIFLRRGFSLRTALLRRTPPLSPLCNSNSPQRILPPPSPPPPHFLSESRRGFAKGRNKSKEKEKDESSGTTLEVLPDMGPTIKANATSHMEESVAALLAELSKLRTGRASPGMLDHIIVETSGLKLPLSQIAVVSVMDSKTLSINPFDPNALSKIETAIVESPLGLNPKTDGERLIAAIPPLTKEHVQAICKVVNKSCEDSRLSIRRGRQKARGLVQGQGEGDCGRLKGVVFPCILIVGRFIPFLKELRVELFLLESPLVSFGIIGYKPVSKFTSIVKVSLYNKASSCEVYLTTDDTASMYSV